MGTRGVYTYSRSLQYRNQTISLPNGDSTTVRIGNERGIDIRIAPDIVRLAREQEFDIALVSSQDQDVSEAADEVKMISCNQNRWLGVVCAFPVGSLYENRRGVNGTQWVKFDESLYNNCLDPNDYRYQEHLTEV